MRAAILSPLAMMGLAVATPSMAQDDLPRWAAGCQISAVMYQGRADVADDARAQAGEAASFWRSAFERVETDAEKRAALVASSQAALDSDLTGKDAAGQKTILATALSVCTRLRPFAERVEKTAEVKP
ncbi:hypothetical protein [Phenylobacterium sp.]|uniref:hypothetical protein n=1 Tax=Phenylobacterium sp. TaxID=1871053 RepID=UPI002ED871EC